MRSVAGGKRREAVLVSMYIEVIVECDTMVGAHLARRCFAHTGIKSEKSPRGERDENTARGTGTKASQK